MKEYHWRARVDGSAEGPVLGAGFLVDGTRVLTCAHVVSGYDEVWVTFPAGEALNGTVRRLTSWKKQNDLGDLALIELERPVAVRPATFARVEEARSLRAHKLYALGFRQGHEISGIYAEVSTDEQFDLSGEWLQANLITEHLQHLDRGFSGAAATLADTGDVVGMITDAELAKGGTTGRMLPLDRIRRYCEELDDLLTLDWGLSADDRGALRRIVTGARTTRPVSQIHAAGFPELQLTPKFISVWDAIRYVIEDQLGELRLTRFLTALLPWLPPASKDMLDAWIRRVLGPAAWRYPLQTAPSSIIVRLDRMTRQPYALTFYTFVAGSLRPAGDIVQVRNESEFRRQVEKNLPDLLAADLQGNWLVELALPTSWLGKPYDQWYLDRASRIRLRTYPLVVRDVARLQTRLLRNATTVRWQVLRSGGATKPQVIDCRNHYNRNEFQAWLEASREVGVLIYAANPTSPQMTAALCAGIPIMLWPRRGPCTRDTLSDCMCIRFLANLREMVSRTRPDDLPAEVMRLRLQAAAPGAHSDHCGHDLTLFWDDPARMPDPPLSMGI
jgi:hypothetical protein